MTSTPNPQSPFNQTSSGLNTEAPKNVPLNNFITPASVTITPNKKSKFGVFVIVGIFIIALIYGLVAYIYFQNQNIKTGNNNNQTASKNILPLTPTPPFLVENIKIVNGNIVYKADNSDDKILINKESYPGSGIIGFLKLTISADKTKICFESWSPAPKPAIYVSNIDGSNSSELNQNRKNCIWSPDSKKVLYVNITAPNNQTDIYVYDLDNKEEKNLTLNNSDNSGKKKFDIVGLSADANTLICNYEYLDTKKTGGQCEINLSTYEISFI